MPLGLSRGIPCHASQITNGLIIGIIYGFMALGLTLIFSILGIVSFSHGEFYMVGGILVYYITAVWLPGITPLLAIAMSCAIVFALGATFERLFLTPMYTRRIDRPVEYGILRVRRSGEGVLGGVGPGWGGVRRRGGRSVREYSNTAPLGISKLLKSLHENHN